MARTFTEIAQAIFNDKNSRTELNSLNSTSKTAIFRNWVYVAANAHLTLETIQDRFEDEVNMIVNSNQIGTPAWYQQQYLKFQLGNDLTLINNVYQYPTSGNSSNLIIEACSVVDSGGTVTAKVAKDDGSGSLIALTSEELNQLGKYIFKIKLAGTKINTVSLNGDGLLMSGCTVYYDGIYSQAFIQSGVTAALNSFILNFPFDGKLKSSSLVDKIQGVVGVNDVVINHLAILSGAIVTPVSRILSLPSGYLVNPNSPNSFNNLISYVAV